MRSWPVVLQLIGAFSLVTGFGLWLGSAGAFIAGGVAALAIGTVAELDFAGEVSDEGPGEGD